MKIFITLGRFVYRPQPPTPPEPVLFDDGLVELARLIAVNDPAKVATRADIGVPTVATVPRSVLKRVKTG